MGYHSSRNKVVPLEKFTAIAQSLRAEGKRIVQCHGVFDLLHPGHIQHFSEARELGDCLVVTLTADRYVNKGPGRPVFNQTLRAETLAALSAVDYVCLSDFPLATPLIREIRPTFYVKGPDYADRKNDITGGIREEEAAVEECGGRIHFTSGQTFSSSELIKQHLPVFSPQARQFLAGVKQHYGSAEIIDQLGNLKSMKVLVIGDTILDEYHYCATLGKSPKETIVSTRYLNEEVFAGGVLACANHIAAFCDNVSLMTLIGDDGKEKWIRSHLHETIRPTFFVRPEGRTTVKRRYLEPAFLSKMFQISFLTDEDLPKEVSQSVCRALREELAQYDVVVVADYGHGFLDAQIREVLLAHSPYLALNVQTNSANFGYNLVTKYPKATYLCIDEPELRLAMGERNLPVMDVIAQLRQRYPATDITVTRGHLGSITLPAQGDAIECPTFSQKIVDRVGAGDAYFAVTSLLAAKNAPAPVLGLIGNAVGAMAVEIVGNRTSVNAMATKKFLKALLS